MGCDTGQCILIVIPSLEGWPTKAKEAPPHEVRLTPLDINAGCQCLMETFQFLGENFLTSLVKTIFCTPLDKNLRTLHG